MRLLEQMKQDYEELGVAIRVLERRTRNGREDTALRKVRAAYARHAAQNSTEESEGDEDNAVSLPKGAHRGALPAAVLNLMSARPQTNAELFQRLLDARYPMKSVSKTRRQVTNTTGKLVRDGVLRKVGTGYVLAQRKGKAARRTAKAAPRKVKASRRTAKAAPRGKARTRGYVPPNRMLNWTTHNKVRGRLPEVEAPAGLKLDGQQTPQEAIAATLQAMDHPAFTPEILATMQAAGFTKRVSSMPMARWIGINLAGLEKKGVIKRTPNGWAAA
jgi:hypothetical protein